MYVHTFVFTHKLTINSYSRHCILIDFFKSLISKANNGISCSSTFLKGVNLRNYCKMNQLIIIVEEKCEFDA